MAIPEVKSSILLSPPSDLGTAIGELRRGQELTAQLVAILRGREGGQHAPGDEVGGLAEQVMAIFSTVLPTLNAGLPDSPTGSDQAGSEGYAGARRTFRPAGERRRGQTRRSQPYGWTRVETKTLEDGHSWRKYGQKDIRDSKYPRCYFRCTHKHDQGCQAARQVQKSEKDPSMFMITYLGQHTCNKSAAPPRPDAEQFVITFGLPEGVQAVNSGHGHLPPPAHIPEVTSTERDDLSHNSSSPDSAMFPELTPLEQSAPMAGDVTSGFLGVDFAAEPFHYFDDMFGVMEQDDLSFVYN